MKRAVLLMAGLFALALVLSVPGSARADVGGGCTAQGRSTSGGTIDLTTASEWHMRSDDIASGSATAPSAMKSATLSAHALGLSLPIASASDVTGTTGEVNDIDMSTFAMLGQRFTLTGSASGDAGTCSGTVTVILDDVNPLLTVLGGGGLGLGMLVVLILFSAMIYGGGFLSRLVGALLGALGGVGLGVGLEQTGAVDPTSSLGLFIVALFIVAGLFLPGSLKGLRAAHAV